jgi:hypothetical protein
MNEILDLSATLDRLQVLSQFAAQHFDQAQLRALVNALLAIPRAG